MFARTAVQALLAVVIGFSTGALVGCQQGGTGGAMMTMPGYGLYYSDEGETAKLAYGVANSDDVGLMLECEKGSKSVTVTDTVRKGAGPGISLISGAQRTNLSAKRQSMEGATLLFATTRTDAAALAAFRTSGELQVISGTVRYGVTATSAEKAGVKRFFAACERA